jgi:putative aminopeptidase FrvX
MTLLHCLTRKKYNWGGKVKTPDGPYFYHDNGCSVLGVAHLDYVLYETPRRYGNCLVCPQLDDRLGVWLLLEQLPRLGIDLDILLTTNEERCRSTAYYFEPAHQYNWVVEFDRAGEDVVFYDYNDWADKWVNHGFSPGYGSYSDIVDLSHLGVMCANIGIGYHQQHTNKCYADIRETNRQIKKFGQFWHDNKEIKFPYYPHNPKNNVWKGYNVDAEFDSFIREM